MSSQFATEAVSWQIYTQPWCDNNVTAQTAGKWAPNLLCQKYLSFAHKWGGERESFFDKKQPNI